MITRKVRKKNFDWKPCPPIRLPGWVIPSEVEWPRPMSTQGARLLQVEVSERFVWKETGL